MMNRLIFSLCLLSAAGSLIAGPSIAQQSVASKDASVGIILDLQGQVSLNGGGRKLQLLSYLKAGEQVQLETGAKLSISLYANRSVYRFTGPAVLVAEKDQIKALKGTAPEIKQVKEKLVAGADNGQLLTGAIRMRQLPPKIAVLMPENASILLCAPKELTWASAEKASYEVRIVDEDENLIAETRTEAATWALPSNLKWQVGRSYKWTVSFVSDRDGGRYLSSGEFKIADESTQLELQKMKPSEDAMIEDWVLYAAQLQAKSLFQEAREAWKKIAQVRPDLERQRQAN